MINDAALGRYRPDLRATARSDWAACGIRSRWTPSAAEASSDTPERLSRSRCRLFVYDDAEWRTGRHQRDQPFSSTRSPLAGYVVMVAAGLSLLNVFVLGLGNAERERAALRAIG